MLGGGERADALTQNTKKDEERGASPDKASMKNLLLGVGEKEFIA